MTRYMESQINYEIYEEDSMIYGHILGGPVIEFPTYAEAYKYYLELEEKENA